MKSIIGQLQAKSQVKDLLKKETGHAFVILGTRGIGKKTFAREIAKGILCSSLDEEGACDICAHCKYFNEKVHPDYKELMIPEGERGIKVEAVRSKICSDVSVFPQLSSRKVYLIEGDGLNEQGQNALLKTLEEPPPGVCFLLTGTEAESFLPTIISRSQLIYLKPNTEKEILALLQKRFNLPENESLFIARFSEGIPGRAIELAQSTWFRDLREDAAKIFFQIPELSKAKRLIDTYKFFEDNKDHVIEIFSIWQNFLRDFLLPGDGSKDSQIMNTDYLQAIHTVRHKNWWTNEKTNEAALALRKAFAALQTNCSFESTVCALLLSIYR